MPRPPSSTERTREWRRRQGMKPAERQTLESLRERCERAPNPSAARACRAAARRLATRLGVECPPWAERRSAPRGGGRPRTRRVAFGQPIERRRERAADAPIAAGLEVPAELSAWRASGEGRIVHVSASGAVTLYPGVIDPPRQFASVAAALAWVRRARPEGRTGGRERPRDEWREPVPTSPFGAAA